MEISPKRILYLDEVRSLAIILVVVGHLTRLFSYDFDSWLVSSGVFSLTRVGVPLFFTVSGALLLTRKHDIELFLKKRFKRVVLPFIFWIIVYIIAGVILWHYEITATYIMDTAFGVGDFSSIFWFIWSLIGVYLLVPVVSSFIREYKKGHEYLIVITIILSLLFTIGFFDYPNMKYNFKVVFYFFPVFGYFILGSYLHNHDFKYSKKKSFGIGLLLFIVGIIGHFTQIAIKGWGGLSLMPVDFFNLFVISETVGIFIMFKYADVKMIKDTIRPLKEQSIGKVIVLFSSCSFGIYFSHYILLRVLYYMTPLEALIKNNVYLNLPITSIILIAVSWALIWIMSKIPLLKVGSGVK